jgi:hypothetical protein
LDLANERDRETKTDWPEIVLLDRVAQCVGSIGVVLALLERRAAGAVFIGSAPLMQPDSEMS